MLTQITPQWGTQNLGPRTCEHEQLTLDQFLALPPEKQARALEMLDKSIFITCKNAWVRAKIETSLPTKKAGEKLQDWQARTLSEAVMAWQDCPMPSSSLELFLFAEEDEVKINEEDVKKICDLREKAGKPRAEEQVREKLRALALEELAKKKAEREAKRKAEAEEKARLAKLASDLADF